MLRDDFLEVLLADGLAFLDLDFFEHLGDFVGEAFVLLLSVLEEVEVLGERGVRGT